LKNKGKQQRSRTTIETILTAAGRVLVTHGYEKATTNRIAAQAGYSVGTVYQYFENKEDIYGELVDQALAKLLAAAADCPVQETLEGTLRQLLARVLVALEQDTVLVQSIESLLVGQFRHKRDLAFETLVESISELLVHHKNEIVLDDHRMAARIIAGAAEGLANSGTTRLIGHEELEAQALRLQLAYLTMQA
jgi:AcrR family transcriptional regulator